MRIVVGVDWREQSRSAVEEVTQCFPPSELTLVHAVNLGALESYPLVPLMEDGPYREFERAKDRFLEESRQRLARLTAAVSDGARSVRQVCEAGSAPEVILNAAESVKADLVAVGQRGLGRFARQAMGSISNTVLLQAGCATLVAKGPARGLRRVLVAVKGPDDAERVKAWLTKYPLKNPVEVIVINVVPTPVYEGLGLGRAFESWAQAASTAARRIVGGMADALKEAGHAAKGRVVSGDPTDLVAASSDEADLLVVSTHGRKGVHRFLFGSVSHSLVRRVPCSVLIVR